jgi:hypothetical protein
MAFHKSGWWIEGLPDDHPEAMDLGGWTLPDFPTPQPEEPQGTTGTSMPGRDLGSGWTQLPDSYPVESMPLDDTDMTGEHGRDLGNGWRKAPNWPTSGPMPNGGVDMAGTRGGYLPNGWTIDPLGGTPSMPPGGGAVTGGRGGVSNAGSAAPASRAPQPNQPASGNGVVSYAQHADPRRAATANPTGATAGTQPTGVTTTSAPPIGGTHRGGVRGRRLPDGSILLEESNEPQTISPSIANIWAQSNAQHADPGGIRVVILRRQKRGLHRLTRQRNLLRRSYLVMGRLPVLHRPRPCRLRRRPGISWQRR